MTRHDAATQIDDFNADWRAEIATQRHADVAPDDGMPGRAELADERTIDDWESPDPWGDIGPVHHPTRFDLPMSAEPPF